MIKAIFIGLSCFLLFLALHVIIFHYFNIRRRFVVLKRLFYSLIPLYAILFFVSRGGALTIMQLKPELSTPFYTFLSESLNLCVGLGLYIFLWLGYCQFYFIIDRSISVRCMIEIDDSPDKALGYEELKTRYFPDYIFIRRLDQMIENRYVILKDGKYINTTKGRLEARLFRFLKQLLRIGEGG